MDILKYPHQKKRNAVKLTAFGDTVQISVKRFDPDTGEELPPVSVPIDYHQMVQQRTEMVKRVEALDMLLKDVEATNPAIKSSEPRPTRPPFRKPSQ